MSRALLYRQAFWSFDTEHFWDRFEPDQPRLILDRPTLRRFHAFPTNSICQFPIEDHLLDYSNMYMALAKHVQNSNASHTTSHTKWAYRSVTDKILESNSDYLLSQRRQILHIIWAPVITFVSTIYGVTSPYTRRLYGGFWSALCDYWLPPDVLRNIDFLLRPRVH